MYRFFDGKAWPNRPLDDKPDDNETKAKHSGDYVKEYKKLLNEHRNEVFLERGKNVKCVYDKNGEQPVDLQTVC